MGYTTIFLLFAIFLQKNLVEMVKFTKQTKIINIGHLPAHTNGKVDILVANGFTDVSALLCESTPVDKVKDILKSSPNSLFLVGGAMMQGFPDLMADLLTFIEQECPLIKVHKTVKDDFDEGISFPPSAEQVNKSALNICLRLLEQEAEIPCKSPFSILSPNHKKNMIERKSFLSIIHCNKYRIVLMTKLMLFANLQKQLDFCGSCR